MLEINPSHPLIRALSQKVAGGGEAIDNAAFVLLGQARILEGQAPEDGADFAKRVGKLLESSLV